MDSLSAQSPAEDMIGCPQCDAVYALRTPGPGQRTVCARCGFVLIHRVSRSGQIMLALALSVLILVLAAALFPFLTISASGLSNRVSLLDIATSFRSGLLVFVSVTTVLFIVALPALRMALLLYVLIPLELGRAPLPQARPAFRLATLLKAWTMTEIFALGCAVALIKVSDVAQLDFGPAFWMFMVLSALTLLGEREHCTWSTWAALERSGQGRA